MTIGVRRLAPYAVAAGLVVVVAASAYWAGTNAVLPPTIPVEVHSSQTYRAELGTVARSLRTQVTASWPTEQTYLAGDEGVLTSVVHPMGDLAQDGDILATINLEPVVVASGTVPMFRTLQEGVRGPDVAQLQQLLAAQAQFDGPPDGTFDAATRAAVERWQASVGATPDGIVEPGSIVFVEALPARLEVLRQVGERIGPGDELVRVLAQAPAFVARFGAATSAEVMSGTPIDLDAPDGSTWQGALGAFEPAEDGGFHVAVTGALCGDDCGQVPVTGELKLDGRVELVPETAGVVVPVSAIELQASGARVVTLVDGSQRPVKVITQADGFAVVDGLDPGTEIRLPTPPRS